MKTVSMHWDKVKSRIEAFSTTRPASRMREPVSDREDLFDPGF
jgi:hypothetical protein